MTRYNAGVGEDIGFRTTMEDGLIVEEDIGGSAWKLISLFAVIDGHGGPECMLFMK
jgi:serine/threonine protein phosphatase PrpC